MEYHLRILINVKCVDRWPLIYWISSYHGVESTLNMQKSSFFHKNKRHKAIHMECQVTNMTSSPEFYVNTSKHTSVSKQVNLRSRKVYAISRKPLILN